MASPINKSQYITLNSFAVLAAGSLAGPATVNGLYYGYGDTLTGVISGPALLNTTDRATALTQLSTLVSAIGAIGSTAALSNTMTLVAGTRYTVSSDTVIAPADTLTFDAAGNPDAQFFIDATGFTFGVAGTFQLVNGAQSSNIFVVADEITLSADTFGAFIAGPITVVGARAVEGQLLSSGATDTVTVDGNPTVTSFAIDPAPLTVSYSTIAPYGLLTAGNVSATATCDVNGDFYGVQGTLVGTIAGTAASVLPNMTTAVAEMTAVQNAIGAVSTEAPIVTNTDTTLVPGVRYVRAGSVTFSNTVTFDGMGNPDAQFFFFFSSSAVLSINTVFKFINGAQPQNIFSVSLILEVNTTAFGNYIARNHIITGPQLVLGRFWFRNTNGSMTLDTGSVICAPPTSTAPIVPASYSTLLGYEALAAGAITGPATINGLYYGTPGTVSGTISGTATLNTTDVGAAQAQLTTLIGNVTTIIFIFPLPSFPAAAVTLFPGILYTASSNVAITAADVVTFDAANDPDAQFFIYLSTFTLSVAGTFVLANGAQARNVFILSAELTITADTLGVFIGGPLTVVGASTVTGQLLSYGGSSAITIDGGPTIDAPIVAAPIDKTNYLALDSYVLLAAGNLAVPATLNGLYYGYQGTLTGSPVSGGATLNTGGVLSTALTQLTALMTSIGEVWLTAPLTPTMTLVAGVRYTASADVAITSTDVLTFDAVGNANAQFFIDLAGNALTVAGAFVLANGAQSKNIFVMSGDITISADTFGAFIGGPIAVVGAKTVEGQLLSHGVGDTVSVDSNPTITSLAIARTPVVPTDYSTMNTFAVLAAGSLTGPATVNGLYYGYQGTLTGLITGTATLNSVSAVLTDAIAEMNALQADVAAIPASAPITGGAMTIVPGVRYTVSTTTALSASDILSFDAFGDSDAQFFIQVADAATLTLGSSFQFTNGARSVNVYVVGFDVSIEAAVGGTFALDRITVVGSQAITGRLLSPASSETITISNTPSVYAPPTTRTPLTKATYATLLGYEAVAAGDITGPATINGLYYGTPGTVSGTISGTATLNTTDVGAALTQLTTLTTDVSNIVFLSPLPDAPATLYPGIVYTVPATLSSALTLDALDDPDAQFFLVPPASTATLTLQSDSTLVNGAQAQNVFIVNDGGDVLVDNDTNGNIVGDQITVNGARTIEGRVMAYGADPLLINGDPLINNATICFFRGSEILTPQGYVRIEAVRPGDQVCTAGKFTEGRLPPGHAEEGVAEVTWVGRFTANNKDSKTLPIRFKAGSLGTNVPTADLLVSPGHGIVVGDRLALAINLTNGSSIVQDSFASHRHRSLEYYHLEFAHHMAITVNGVLTESYDAMPVNRSVFTTQLTAEDTHLDPDAVDAHLDRES